VTRRHISSTVLALGLLACAEGVVDGPTRAEEPTQPSPSAGEAEAEADADAEAEAEAEADAEAEAEAEAPADAAAAVTPPTVDAVLSPAEYGAHVDGQNRQASPGAAPTTTWYMTWTETHLHVAVSAANVAEGMVLYVEHASRAPSTSGTSADGSLVGMAYDGTRAASLPFRADFVAYVKSTYQEHRRADGAGGWGAPIAAGLTVQGAGDVREIAIPWTAIRAAGRPASFSWLGYVTSPGGYVYGAMPPANPGASVGTSATFGFFYGVTNAAPGAGTKPFSLTLSP
jgi:hypothetical protein